MRRTLLAAAGSPRLRHHVESNRITRSVVHRFVPGRTAHAALEATQDLQAAGLRVSLDHLGEDTLDRHQAVRTVGAYVHLLERLNAAGLSQGGGAEVSLKLSALGLAIDPEMAHEHAQTVCSAASAADTFVTLDMEDHTTTDLTLGILLQLRQEFPDAGVAVQAYLHRTEDDCNELSRTGARVRLCKGAYREPAAIAFQARAEVNASYERCLRLLFEGDGYPMVATHDPRLIAIASELSKDRPASTYEYQMLYGIRPHEQARLSAQGDSVRVYVPYGDEWYGYLMRRLAERPANLALFLRALVNTR